MKRLLIVATVPETLRSFLLPFGPYFRARGWQIEAAAQGVAACELCRSAFDELQDIPFSRNPLDWRRLFAAAGRIRSVVRAGRYDLVHVHTPVAAFVTRLALLGLSRSPRLIYTAHGFHFYRGGRRLRNLAFLALEKLAGWFTDWLVVINAEDFEAATRHRLVAKGHVVLMPGIGLDTALYGQACPRDAMRESLGVPRDAPLFTAVAEFSQRKRHRDLVTAFSRLGDPRAYLALAGEGPLMQEMRDLTDELGISSRVLFLGWRRDVPDLLGASTAAVLVSEQEGLPRCVMEAMCQGVPVIASRIRGVRDLLGDTHPLLVEVGDVETLAAALRWVAAHPQEALAIGARGPVACAKLELDGILRFHEALYAKALAPESGSPGALQVPFGS